MRELANGPSEDEYLPALEAAATVCIPVSVAVSLSDGQPPQFPGIWVAFFSRCQHLGCIHSDMLRAGKDGFSFSAAAASGGHPSALTLMLSATMPPSGSAADVTLDSLRCAFLRGSQELMRELHPTAKGCCGRDRVPVHWAHRIGTPPTSSGWRNLFV